MTNNMKGEDLIVPERTGLLPVEGLRFDSAIVPCALNFDESTGKALAELSITKGQPITNGSRRAAFFGDVNDPLMLETTHDFVGSLGDNCEQSIALISRVIVDLARNAALITGDEATWLELRADFKANDYFDIPRWHCDGTFFDTTPEETPYKFATTLIGPSTRLGYTEDRQRFMDLLGHPEAQIATPEGLRIRKQLATLVCEFTKAELGDGNLFLVGHKKEAIPAAIHSEPPVTGPRLFMFTLGGPLEKIKALGGRRKNG